MDEITTRIIKESGCPQLFEILSKISSSDLQSLLIKLYQDKALNLNPTTVLKQYETNRFVNPADISPLQLLEFEKLAFSSLPSGFEGVLFSPLSPFGNCSALGTVNQNKVVSTIRNTEVCADSTNTMALESAKRRKSVNIEEIVRLASCHRLVRAQKFDNPAFTSHFSVFCLTTAGRMTADYDILLTALLEHIEFYLKLLKSSDDLGLVTDNIKIGITAINLNLKQKLQEQIINPLSQKYPEFTFLLDQTRKSALNYYKDFSLAINIKSPLNGNYYQLIDGGNTDWTQKLLNNRKEFFISSCIGIDLFLKMFKKTQDSINSKTKIIIDDELELSDILPEDAETLAFHADNQEIASYLKDIFPHPYTINDANNFIKMILTNDINTLGIRYKGEIIGTIGITPGIDIHRNEAEIGYWLGQSYWNKGIMARCIKSYTSYIFSKYHFNRIFAEIFADNTASVRVLEKVGFIREGTLKQNIIKNNKLKDSYIYALYKRVM